MSLVWALNCPTGLIDPARIKRDAVCPESVEGPCLQCFDKLSTNGLLDKSCRINRGWLALFRFGDEIRPQAAAMVDALRADGRRVVLLTGDASPVAHRVAKALGIDEVEAGVTPQGKYDYVTRLQSAGAIVAMVGDGVNDAPVLAQAQVSIAMGGGSQLARTPGALHIAVFIAAAANTGASVASSVEASRVSARPCTQRPRVVALSGASSTNSPPQ